MASTPFMKYNLSFYTVNAPSSACQNAISCFTSKQNYCLLINIINTFNSVGLTSPRDIESMSLLHHTTVSHFSIDNISFKTHHKMCKQILNLCSLNSKQHTNNHCKDVDSTRMNTANRISPPFLISSLVCCRENLSLYFALNLNSWQNNKISCNMLIFFHQ